MKAVRSTGGGVSVVDLDDPPGSGELVAIRAASICASVSWHALRLADTRPGKRVAVVGAGALGLLAVAGALRQGGEDVAIEARHPHQHEAAERLGARTKPEGRYEVVIEAAGTPASLA